MQRAKSLATVLVLCWEASVLAAERPNILLVMADDLGWGDVQCFDPSSPVKTPHLDALAAAGMKFTRFYAQAPVCSPTRGSCLTGRHPYRYEIHFANDGHIKPEEITLPELLREHGYTTGHFGKWHLGTLTTTLRDANRGGPQNSQHFAPPPAHGYDVCFATESKVPTFDPMLKPPAARGDAWDYLKDRSHGLPYGTRYWNERGEAVEEDLLGDDSKLIMDRAVNFIESSVNSHRPFFATIWFHAPHLPVVAGPDHVAPYARYDLLTRNYYGCIAALDEQVGRLRQSLQTLGVAENTMLWFCSDNGPEGQAGKAPGSAGPYRGRKRSLYEGGVRVPGILVWPGKVQPGVVTDFPAVTSDYLPTILAALQVPFPDDRPLDGISLLPLLEGTMHERSQPIGFQSQRQKSLVTQQYKLYWQQQSNSWELYDLLGDPQESRNLAASDPERVAQLSRQLEEWIASCRRSAAGEDY